MMLKMMNVTIVLTSSKNFFSFLMLDTLMSDSLNMNPIDDQQWINVLKMAEWWTSEHSRATILSSWVTAVGSTPAFSTSSWPWLWAFGKSWGAKTIQSSESSASKGDSIDMITSTSSHFASGGRIDSRLLRIVEASLLFRFWLIVFDGLRCFAGWIGFNRWRIFVGGEIVFDLQGVFRAQMMFNCWWMFGR